MSKVTRYDPDIEMLLGGSGPLVIDQHGTPQAMGAFEGADRFNRELALWAPALMSADLDIFEAKDITDARARDMLRNDALVSHGSTLHKDNIVGSFYLLNAKPELAILGWDQGWADAFQEEVESKFTIMAESPNNWLDAQRINTFTGLIRLGVGVELAAGELLAAAEWIRDDPLRLYRTAIQMIDLDRLSNPFNVMTLPNIRRGVERDGRGAPIAYHIRQAHPTDFMNANSYQWKRIPRIKPWGRLQIIHIYDQTRPDQTRGISQMVSVLKESKMGKKFRDLTLQNAAIQATYAASIESDLPSEAVFSALGGGNMGQLEMGSVITAYASAYLHAISEYAGSSRNINIDGVKIPHLFPGTKLQLRPAGTPGGVGTDFEASLNRHLAANLGVSYEELTKDFTKTNYSGFKGGLNETRKYMAARKKSTADRLASAIYGLWFEEAMNLGELECMKGKEAHFYEGFNKDAYLACDWIGASVGQIDELKETQAAALRINARLTTYEDELGRLGKDWRKVFAQLKREQDMLTELGIPLVQTNAMNAATGDARNPEGSEDDKEGKTDAEDRRPGDSALVEVVGDAMSAMAEFGQQMNAASNKNTAAVVRALQTLAQRDDPPPVVHVSPPHVKVDVHTPKAGGTQTRVLEHDEKGRILRTETVPIVEEE